MLHPGKSPDFDILAERLSGASRMSLDLITVVISTSGEGFASAKTARLNQLLRCSAWTDAALALIELELPQWRIRRLAYDDGEWYCALSRERELPDWLDQSIEARHADLSLAILTAFVEARCVSTPAPRASVPAVRLSTAEFYESACVENFL